MTQSAFFKMLGAPLHIYWSWGAARGADGAILLRVWEDRVRTIENRQFVRILDETSRPTSPREHGRRERMKHVKRIRLGARCYLIMCEAKDTAAHPRQIRRFNAKEVFAGGDVKEFDGHVWVERVRAVTVEEFMHPAQ